MLSADTNSWIAYLAGGVGVDVDQIEKALQDRCLVISPVVLAELFSDPELPANAAELLQRLPALEIADGYWVRAGRLRASLLRLGYKPRLADTLIAQSCIDEDALLVTRDQGFRGFAKHAGLKLLGL